jgi:hypothetical protein
MQKVLEFVVTNWDAIAGIVGTLLAWLWMQPAIAAKRAAFQTKLDALHLTKAQLIAEAVVASAYQTTVRKLKETGKFDADMKQAVAESAARTLKQQLADANLGFLGNLAPSLIEYAVNTLKDSAPAKPIEGPELVDANNPA